MHAIIVLIFIGIIVAGGFLAAFIWAVRSGQYDDDYSPSVRILFDNKEVDEFKSLGDEEFRYQTVEQSNGQTVKRPNGQTVNNVGAKNISPPPQNPKTDILD